MPIIECLACGDRTTVFSDQNKYVCCCECYDPFAEILRELKRARAKFPDFNSPHEGYAVLKEEVEEMWDAIKNDDTKGALEEAVQVGAMALRFISDCSK